MTTLDAPAPLLDVLERDRALHLLKAWKPHVEMGCMTHRAGDGGATALLADDPTIRLYACGHLAERVASVTYRPTRYDDGVHFWYEWTNNPHEAAAITPERVRHSFPIYLPKLMVLGFLKRGWAKHGKVPLHVTAAAATAHRLTQVARDIKNHHESIRRLADEKEAYTDARAK